MVNKSPNYYTRGSIEIWDFIRDQDLNYHLGNAIKYICRAGYKDSKVDDLKKAIHYLENELEHTSNRIPYSVSSVELAFQQDDTEAFDR